MGLQGGRGDVCAFWGVGMYWEMEEGGEGTWCSVPTGQRRRG